MNDQFLRDVHVALQSIENRAADMDDRWLFELSQVLDCCIASSDPDVRDTGISMLIRTVSTLTREGA